MNLPLVGLGQSKIQIIYYPDHTNNEFTKFFIASHDFYLLIDTCEFEIIKYSDTVMYGPKLNLDLLNKIDTLSMVNVKIKNEHKCYITPFPNVFRKNEEFLRIDFYRMRNGYIISKRVLWLWYSKKIAMNYTIPVSRSLRTGVLVLENCN